MPDARARIREAYLRAWTERGPLAGWPARRIGHAFDLAQRVALLHYAVQFRLAVAVLGLWRDWLQRGIGGRRQV